MSELLKSELLKSERPKLPRRMQSTPQPSQVYTNRYEIKYLVPARDLDRLRDAISGLVTPDKNNGTSGGYYNHSIYFDSPHYRYYTEKHEGDLERMKPRLRFYRPSPQSPALSIALELKGRYDRIVRKRRCRLDLHSAEAMLTDADNTNALSDLDDPVAREFCHLSHRFNLQPCVTVLYHRSAYFSHLYRNLRITFDSAVQCSLATRSTNPSDSYLECLTNGDIVVEVKYNEQIPKILLNRLHALGMQQRTFSKFAVSLERCFTQYRGKRYRSGREF